MTMPLSQDPRDVIQQYRMVSLVSSAHRQQETTQDAHEIRATHPSTLHEIGKWVVEVGQVAGWAWSTQSTRVHQSDVGPTDCTGPIRSQVATSRRRRLDIVAPCAGRRRAFTRRRLFCACAVAYGCRP